MRGRRAGEVGGGMATTREGDGVVPTQLASNLSFDERCHEPPSAPVSLVNGREATPKGAQA
jgi:hypothetical protein